MAYRKASEENPVVALGSEDFWAAVQNGGDVRISVGDILVWLRTVLKIEDVNELQAALDAIGATAHQELQDALGAMGGSVSESLETLQADVNTRATKTELTNALGGLDGSVKAKIDALAADVATRATKTEEKAKDDALRVDVVAGDNAIRADVKVVTDKLASDLSGARSALQTDIDTRATKAQLGTAAARNAGNAAGQVPVLNADNKLDASVIPAVAITDTFTVATQAAMLASGAERGDIAIRSDLNRCYILQVEPATTLANWKELLTPTDAVLSVAGLTGAITAAGLKAALGIAIGDVAGLQAALTSIRTDFASADTAIRADMTAGLATKFDKTGGTVSGDVTATGMVRSDRLTYTRASNLAAGTDLNTIKIAGFYDGSQLVNAPDANWWYVEVQRHTGDNGYIQQRATRLNGTPEVYVRNSTGTAAGFGPWYRVWTSLSFDPASKASLNASVSFSALTVSARPTWAGLTPWDNGNFDPSTKANVAGQTFTGNVYSRVGTSGYAGLMSGDANASGFVEFRDKDGARHGYVGYGSGSVINIAAENGYRYNFNVAPTIAGATIHTSANFDPGTKANLAGAAFTAAISAPGATINGTADFGTRLGQHIFLYGSAYGFGIQNGTLYARTGGEFAVHTAGAHSATQADPGTGGTNLMRLSASLFTYKGSTVWGAWNFNPDTKANLAGATFSGAITAPELMTSGGSSGIRQYARDGNRTSYLYNTGNLWRVYDDNAATAGDRFRVNLVDGSLWSSQLGDINTRIEDRAYAHAVAQANDRLAVARGEYANHAKLSGATYTGAITAPTIYATGGVVVGSGQTSSTLTMADTDEGSRYVHNNGGSIGFLGKAGGWTLRSFEDGNIWTPAFGYLNDYVGQRVAKTGDQMSGELKIAMAAPRVKLDASGVGGFSLLVHNDNRLYIQKEQGWTFQNNCFSIGADGSIWTNQFGDLNTRIEDRAYAHGNERGAAWARQESVARANERVAKTGDTMSGDLEIGKTYPNLKLHYHGVRIWDIQVREDGRLYFWGGDGQVTMSVGTGGDISTRQLGDINTRIEDRAFAWAADRASYRVAKTGDTMSGNLVISKENPELQLLWGGVFRWGIITRNNAELQFRNADNDSVALAIRPGGSLWSQQMGDIHQHIRDVVNNKSIRLAYAGDLSNDWNKDQNYAEPYGGGVLTSRYVLSNQFIVDSWKGGRWRYLQMSDAWGNWYTCGYV